MKKTTKKKTPSAAGMFDDPHAKFTSGAGDAAPVRKPAKKKYRSGRAEREDETYPKPPVGTPEPAPAPVVEAPPVVEPLLPQKGRTLVEIVAEEEAALAKKVVIAEDCQPALPGVVESVVKAFAEEEAALAKKFEVTIARPAADNREAWLSRAVCLMEGRFIATGHNVPAVRVSCGWPATKGLSNKGRAIGECWSKDAAKDGVCQIFISPFLDQTVTPALVLATLVHEVVHAAVGVDKKHGKEFKKCAAAVGLEGKMTATVAGAELLAVIADWEKTLGPYPHAQLDALKRPTKKQGTRMIKCECADCGYVARTTRKWLDLSGSPICGCNQLRMKFEAPDEAGEDADPEDASED